MHHTAGGATHAAVSASRTRAAAVAAAAAAAATPRSSSSRRQHRSTTSSITTTSFSIHQPWQPLQHDRLPAELLLLQQQAELDWLAEHHGEQDARHGEQQQQEPWELPIVLPLTHLQAAGAAQARQQHAEPTADVQQPSRAQLAPSQQAARALTKAIGGAPDAPQLLLLLSEHAQQLDAIHVSAAVKRACRQLRLNLAVPDSKLLLQQQQQQQVVLARWLQALQGESISSSSALHQQQQQQQLSDDWQLLLVLAGLCQAHSSAMASQQLCTCVSGLAELVQRHPQLPLLLVRPLRTALQALLQAAQLQTCDTRALSLLLHTATIVACSRAGFAPSAAFMRAWFRASRAQLQQGGFSSLDLAMSAGALGRLAAFPPAEWMAAFWAASKAALPSCSTDELLHLLLGAAGTRRRPPAGWMEPAARQLQAALPGMSPSQLSATMLALAKLHYSPSAAWMASFWAAWEVRQAAFSTKGHATIMWSMGRVQPGTGASSSSGSSSEQAVFARQVQAALQHAVARTAKAVAGVALQKLRQAALAQQQQQQQGEVQQLPSAADSLPLGDVSAPPALPAPAATADSSSSSSSSSEEQPQLLSSASLLHPTDCAMVLYGLARLGRDCVDPSFPPFWLAQARSQAGNMNSQELSICMWGLGKLQLQPPEPWLQQHLACTARLASCMSHRQLAMVLWGCARLQYLPNVAVTAELLMAAAQELPRFTPHSLSLLLWSLGALRMRPNKEWMQLALAHAWSTLGKCDGQDLTGLAVGLAALRFNPGQAWLHGFASTLAAKVQLVTPRQHASIIPALRALGYSCEDKPFAWVMESATVAAMCGWPSTSSSSSSSVQQASTA